MAFENGAIRTADTAPGLKRFLAPGDTDPVTTSLPVPAPSVAPTTSLPVPAPTVATTTSPYSLPASASSQTETPTPDSSSGTKVLVSLLPFEVELEMADLRRILLDDTQDSDKSPLSVVTRARNMLSWFGGSRELTVEARREASTSVDYDALTDGLQNYLHDYFTSSLKQASGSVMYAPFHAVVLTRNTSSRHQRHRFLRNPESGSRLSLDGLFLPHDGDLFELYDAAPAVLPIDESATLARALTTTVTTLYDGVSIFVRDGDLPVPNSTAVQAIQSRALTDTQGSLLSYIQASNAGFTAVSATVLASGSQSESGSDPASGNSTSVPGSIDTVILIAIIVAGLSMCLLGLALFLAFRRKRGESRSDSGSPTFKSSKNHSHNSEDITPPTAYIQNSGRRDADEKPIVDAVDITTDDDCISDYTESVISERPMSKAFSPARETAPVPSVEQSNPPESGIARASSRFNPKYIMNNIRHNGVAVPEAAAENKKSKKQPWEDNADEENDRPSIAKYNVDSATSLPSTPISLSDLYTESVIDDDIHSSLSAYTGPGKGNPNKYDPSTKKNKGSILNDNASVSSMESYGYSLDGIGDYNTVAGNSTQYGY